MKKKTAKRPKLVAKPTDAASRLMTRPSGLGRLYDLAEIEALADFLFAKVIGQGPMTHAKCIDYWGSEVEACTEFPN